MKMPRFGLMMGVDQRSRQFDPRFQSNLVRQLIRGGEMGGMRSSASLDV
jgi:hypothetical protein